jgi:hypothetical protein
MWPAKRIDIEAAEEAGLKIECIIIQPRLFWDGWTDCFPGEQIIIYVIKLIIWRIHGYLVYTRSTESYNRTQNVLGRTGTIFSMAM